MHTHGLGMKAIFYRPVILYALGQISFFKMLTAMAIRFTALLALAVGLLVWVAYDQGVFDQDGSRPDPGIADAVRHRAEDASYKG